jgi:hypothetical protein
LGRALLIPDPLLPGNHRGLAPQAPPRRLPQTSCLDVAAVAADRGTLSAYSPAP